MSLPGSPHLWISSHLSRLAKLSATLRNRALFRWRTVTLILLLAVPGSLYLSSLEWCGTSLDGMSPCRRDLLGELKQFVYDYQTLITGALAIVAAYITTTPARRQLKLMALQSSIMARDVIAERLKETEDRHQSLNDEIRKVRSSWNQILPWHDEEPLVITAPWAFETEQLARRVREVLNHDRVRLHDPQDLNDKKAAVEQSLERLEKCLNRVHLPESTNFDDPEIGLSDAQIIEEMEKAEAAATEAKEKLSDLFGSVENARRELSQKASDRILALRKRLRMIDDAIDTDAHASDL